MKKRVKFWLSMAFLLLANAAMYAQEAGADSGTAAEGTSTTFGDVVLNNGIINLLIWLLIFATSFATVAFMIDGILQVRREKILPPFLVNGVRDALDDGDLDAAINICETNPCQLSNILMAGFTNITEGFEAVQDAVSAATDIESERIIQRIGYLNLCGQISPMLGLLGTVAGMVKAFSQLSNAGADKDKQLANAISTALLTTMCGLLIAVPALLAFTIFKNLATTRLLETEATVLDLIKVLRSAEVEDDRAAGEFADDDFADDEYED